MSHLFGNSVHCYSINRFNSWIGGLTLGGREIAKQLILKAVREKQLKMRSVFCDSMQP